MKHKKVDEIAVINMAITFVKSNPCGICSLQGTSRCEYIRVGWCEIEKQLKEAFKNVKEVKNEKERPNS